MTTAQVGPFEALEIQSRCGAVLKIAHDDQHWIVAFWASDGWRRAPYFFSDRGLAYVLKAILNHPSEPKMNIREWQLIASAGSKR